jgi:hypothetical protein
VELSLLNEWFGLSWNGRKILLNTGMQLPKSTYREKKKKLILKVQHLAKEEFEISKNVAILWLDNFNDIYIKGYTFGAQNGNFHNVMAFNLLVPYKTRNCYCNLVKLRNIFAIFRLHPITRFSKTNHLGSIFKAFHKNVRSFPYV